MAHALLQLQRPDSAAACLDRLDVLAKSAKRSGVQGPGGNAAGSNKAGPGSGAAASFRINELDLGTNDVYRGDLLAGKGDFLAAVQQLQRAVIIFSAHFNDTDVFSNPANFTGSFASYRLFDALFKKAVILEQLYKAHPEEKWLLA